ncbi:NYN domain-containing protein [Methylosinus sp. PW1]|uniref:NYN domain-containing protein n=1 Tax=Methylosinus sp. PW1 TaxID=107636 RepID=UPI0009FE9C4A|nr:NYN domain-containing protein [Methylosinus sp. PW1]
MFQPLYAILLDGGFLTKKLYAKLERHPTADDIVAECERLQNLQAVKNYELLRIYYYDAPPSADSVTKPVSRTRMNLATTERFRLSQSLYDQLVLKPHFALRMGETRLSPDKWRIKPRVARSLVSEQRALGDDDFELDLSQKGVDMRIGLDMARLALRETVRAVVVVTGDSDFVPAFKFARREGVKVILDPLGHNVRTELRAHSDVVVTN